MGVRGMDIVVTGAGLNCCLGLDRHEVWRAVREGRCGIGPLSVLEQPDPSRDGGQYPPLDESGHTTQPREVQYLQRAIREALHEANLTESNWPDPHRIGIVLGTTLAGMRAGGDFLRSSNPSRLDSFLAGSTLQLAVGDIPICGANITTCAACASGLSAIAIGMTLLRQGELDIVIVGGYDPICEYVYAGFKSLRLVTDGPPLPFSRHRQGMKLGEGSGIVILERSDDARRRGMAPLARILGFGESSDAFHLTKPQPQGVGAAAAMLAALAEAGLESDDIDMISAHATATANNDAAEYQAYRQVFGDRLSEVPVTAFKSHVGHTLGAAGAVELILSIMSMHNGVVPPLASVHRDDIEFDGLNVVTGSCREAQLRYTINLSMGFGGANSCVVVGRADSDAVATSVRSRDGDREVCITGVGIVAPGCIGNEAFLARVAGFSDCHEPIGGQIDEAALLPLFANARRVRRFSAYVKLMLAATNIAVRDADLDTPEGAALIEQSCAFLGTTQGTVEFTEAYYRQVVAEGIDAANPMLFAEGVPNVASAQLSLLLNLRGSSQTIIGTRTAGLEALHLAAHRIASGACDRVFVGAAEEHAELVNRAYRSCGLCRSEAVDSTGSATGANGFVTGAGAVVMVVEARDAAQRRGAPIKAVIGDTVSHRVVNHPTENVRQVVNAARAAFEGIGRPLHIVSSGNNTWIDRVEKTAIEQAADDSASVRTIYGPLPEMFSVTPMAALALAVLSPAQHGSAYEPGNIPIAETGVLATDYKGSITAVRVRFP